MSSLKSPRSVAELLGVSYRTVLRLIEDGELGAYRVRSRLRISDEHIEEYFLTHLAGAEIAPHQDLRPFYKGGGSLVRLSQELQAEGS